MRIGERADIHILVSLFVPVAWVKEINRCYIHGITGAFECPRCAFGHPFGKIYFVETRLSVIDYRIEQGVRFCYRGVMAPCSVVYQFGMTVLDKAHLQLEIQIVYSGKIQHVVLSKRKLLR